MNPDVKRHLVSFGLTFVSTFFTVIGFTISSPGFTFTKESLVATFIAGVVSAARALAKVVYEVSSSVATKSE